MHQHDFDMALIHTHRLKRPKTPWRYLCTNILKFKGPHTTPMRAYENWLKSDRTLPKKGPTESIQKPMMLGQVLHKGLKLPDMSELSDLDIIRIRYGKIAPTRYVSKLDNDDWIDRYIHYEYFTDDPEAIAELKKEWRTGYLTKLRNMIWTLITLLVLLPRGYGKTESVLALFVRWILEIREPLYIVTSSSAHSKNLLKRIERQLKSPAIRRDYGDIFEKVSYDREMMTLIYHEQIEYSQFDPPVSVVTWNSAKEGPHPAWIHFDDVMQKEFKNIESNEDIKIKYSKVFAKMRIRRGDNMTKISATATRYAVEDMYSYLMDIQKFPVLHEMALDDNDVWLYCPNYTKDDLLEERAKDLPSFETSMNNNPTPSTGTYFKEEDWVETDDDLTRASGQPLYYLVMDPARGVSDFADRTAILVIGFHDGIATVVDGYVGRIDDDDKLIKVNTFYAKYLPNHTVIEKAFAQIDMRRFSHIRGLVPYQDTTRNAKILRISSMKPYFVDGLIRVLKGIQPYKYIHGEYLSYNETPSTPTRKDDSIDAVSIVIQLFGQYLKKYTETEVDWSKVGDFHLTS